LTWYQCGPTVYDESHMGHARNYVTFDIIRRILSNYFGYNIKMVMNITDIDDKIINKSIESGQNFEEISRHFENEFWSDMRALGCQLPEQIVRVSEFVPEIVKYIEKIIQNGYAYESKGSVYFDVVKFNEAEGHKYAKLEPTSVSNLEAVEEAEGKLTDKDNIVKKNK